VAPLARSYNRADSRLGFQFFQSRIEALMFRRVLLVSVAIMVAAAGVQGQWLNYPDPRIPRLPDGKPNLSAQPLRAEGKPDLSGVWKAEITPESEWRRRFGDAAVETRLKSRIEGMGIGTNSIYSADLMLDIPPEEQAQLLRPAAVDRMRQLRIAPSESCLPLGFPMASLLTPVTKLTQAPNVLIMLLEEGNVYRQIYLDGRPLPKDPQPSWLGYSVGRWEGETLVVETNGLNDKTVIDGAAHPRSESMHMTERYRRRDVGHMDVEMTFNDPVYYTRPFTAKVTWVLQPDTDILEYVCNENEKDRAHMVRP